MASGTTVVTSSNGANMIQMAPGLPSGDPQQVPQKGPLERFFNAEYKVLGAIQILIGLIHIGFGAIPFGFFPHNYLPFSGIGGVTFLGGIFFISSGSLCVAVANRPNRGLVKSSVGMNIASAVIALIDIILHICEVIVSISALSRSDTFCAGCAISVLLFLFSLLEFCIAVSLAHFSLEATFHSGPQ